MISFSGGLGEKLGFCVKIEVVANSLFFAFVVEYWGSIFVSFCSFSFCFIGFKFNIFLFRGIFFFILFSF